ncbi:MAG: hypothetical protein LBP67_05010 [Bacteroidales bacterium]|jgi:hypothetical protein|nr:hypothetical protein [Bacteroidales bacterium]
MIRLKEIEDSLIHLVGWQQAFNPAEKINDDLTISESGRFFQEEHPLVTLENIRSVIPLDFTLQYPKWNMITIYKKGDKVRYNDEVFIAKQDNQNIEPKLGDFNNDYNEDFAIANDNWEGYNFLSDYLTFQTKSGIKKAVSKFLDDKKISVQTKDLLERRTLYEGAGRRFDIIKNRQSIVGFEINPVRSMGVTVRIEKIGLQFAGALGKVKLYLYHSSRIEPIETIECEIKTDGDFAWFDADWYLPYISDDINSGGTWYLCYNQDELPEGMFAVNFPKDWSVDPCGGCNQRNNNIWKLISKYLKVTPFRVPVNSEFPIMWDISNNMYTLSTSYGVNFQITVGCDLTDFIISQRSVFADVVAKQVSATVLRTISMNPAVRPNPNALNVSRLDILYEIDGNTAGRPGGLGYDLKKAYAALDINTDKMDRICLGCKDEGVTYKSVF